MERHMSVSVKKSVNGRGIFAERDFEPEETIFEVTGPLVTGDEDDEMDDTTRSNTFRYDADHYISPAGTIGDFQNHSCEPNAKVVKIGKRLFVAAAEPIRKGDEVLIDYSTIIARDDVWVMDCLCGSGVCRGTIASFDSLPKALQNTYKKSGMVPRYILEI